MKLSEMRPGDRVYRWVYVGTHKGCDQQAIQPLTVIRVNRKTVTVRNDYGTVGRLEPQEITGRVDWE